MLGNLTTNSMDSIIKHDEKNFSLTKKITASDEWCIEPYMDTDYSQINEDQDANLAKSIVKLQGTELRHELEGLAIDAMGELGTLYEDSPHLRDEGAWQMTYMYFLGLIIGGGTNQIQKNIISERALGMPKEPKIQGA